MASKTLSDYFHTLLVWKRHALASGDRWSEAGKEKEDAARRPRAAHCRRQAKRGSLRPRRFKMAASNNPLRVICFR
jgi:hypothetical protein